MKRLLAAVLVGLLIAPPVLGAARTANTDGLYSATATWSGAAVPTNADDCTINAGVEVVCDQASCVCGSLVANGGLLYKPGAREVVIGDGLTGGTSDNLTIGSAGFIAVGPAQALRVNTANTTGAARGTVIVNGYLSAVGSTLLTDALVSQVGAVSGSWPTRTVQLTASGLDQVATDALAGKVLVATSGWFREASFDITANTQATITVRIDGSAASGTHRGQVDSRNKAGRIDAGITWAPGDWGENIDGGSNSAPATATVANGGTSVTVSGAWPGGTSRMTAFLGSRFICAADLGAASDGDFRVIDSITDTTHFVLKTAYGTGSCAAGGDYRILVDNQPPNAAAITEAFNPGDRFDVIDPAIIGIPTASWSDSTQTAQIDRIEVPDGGTFVARNAEIGNCGHYIAGASARGCLMATSIDNNNADEGLYLDRVEFHHYGGVAAIDLEDSANITINRPSIRDAAEGGNATTVAAGTCPADEAHGIRINDNSGGGRVSGIRVTNGRIVRTNDVSYSPFSAGESDGINCANCALRNMFMGFTPNSCGGSTQCIGMAAGTTNFQGSDIFCTNAPGSYAVSTNLASTGHGDGYIAWSIFQNSVEGGFKINQLNDTNGTTDANTNFYFVADLFRNLGGADVAGLMQRGRWYSSWIEPGNKGVNQVISEPQELKGNVIIVPPNFDSGGSVLNHEPTGTARIEPAVLREWDLAILGPTSYALGTESPFLGGKHGVGNDALASDADFRHITIFAFEDLTSGDNVGWRFRDNGTGVHAVKDSIFTNIAASYTRVNGSESVTGDYNLCVKVVVNQCPLGMSAGANTLTSGIPGLLDPANGDFRLVAGSTAAASLGSDGLPRGVRVAGPPNWERLQALVPGLGPKPVIVNITAAQGGIDSDLDGVWDLHDNCDDTSNANQYDGDADGIGCACDTSGDTCP